VPADGDISLRILAPEIMLGDTWFWSRPEGDVEACNSISVRFISTFDVFEVDTAFPVFFTNVSAP